MADPHDRPRVSVRSLGGTVAMTSARPGPAGAVPTVDAAGLVHAVPRLAEVAAIDAASLCATPSASLDLRELMSYPRLLESACRDGSDGVVVTTGTDTMEEVAYLFDLLWGRPEPLVLTGAMRTADSPGADGPANLLAAVTVAAALPARGRGCLVVMNDEVHSAETVRKLHTTSTAAFASPASGPVGRVHEGTALLRTPPVRREVLDVDLARQLPRVALVRVGLGDDTAMLDHAVQTYDGVVVEAMGGGHVPAWWAEPLLAAARRVPVMLASRTGCGPLLERTYGFTGSERQLLDGGVLSAGALDGLKARILLTVALMSTGDACEVASTVARRS